MKDPKTWMARQISEAVIGGWARECADDIVDAIRVRMPIISPLPDDLIEIIAERIRVARDRENAREQDPE